MHAESFEAPSLERLAELLPAYEFDSFIAQGGMGAVYQARQRSLDRDVAIKILPREMGADPGFRKSFETEAKAMARLNHPNLIGVYDFGDADGMPYIVMELVKGKSLFHSAYQMAVDPEQAVSIVKGICDGLAHAHENGVIHRDIKPANILLTPKAEPKIGDFGLARPAGTGDSGVLMGTPGYVAPEIIRHPDHADRRSDLFALGVVLYELLVGRCPPYDGHQPVPSSVCGCDPALDRICEKAMHPVAAMRYPNAEAMSAALGDWLRRGASRPAAQPGRRPVPTSGLPRPAQAGLPRPRPLARRSSGSAKWLLALVLVAAAGAFAWSKFGPPAARVQPGATSSEPTPPVTAAEPEIPPASTANPSPRVEPAPVPVDSGTALNSLASLQKALVSGSRDTMPAGSFGLGDTRVMIVPTAMTWAESARFAEEHGGHLFVASGEEELEELAGLLPEAAGARYWIGAGRWAEEEISWVDASPWHLSTEPEGEGEHVAMSRLGKVSWGESGDRLPFVIQWQSDGSNPGSLDAMLRRTGESIVAGKPVLPPGTLRFNEHFIYVVTGTSSSLRASDMATLANGHLLVLLTEEKDRWLDEKLRSAGMTSDYWIGGYRRDGVWRWVTREPWEYHRWEGDKAPSSSRGDLVKFTAGKGWNCGRPGEPASGFIIEWDSTSDEPEDDGSPSGGDR